MSKKKVSARSKREQSPQRVYVSRVTTEQCEPPQFVYVHVTEQCEPPQTIVVVKSDPVTTWIPPAS